MQEDVLLVDQAIAGDETAFCLLVQKYHKPIYARILSVVHNPDDAEEITNDVFIESYRCISSLKQPPSFYAWLCRIALHNCQDWRRKSAKTRCMVSLDDIHDNIVDYQPDSIEDEIIYRERLERTLEAIESLPKIDKSLMQDFYLENVPYKTLQQRYGLSKASVNVRLIRARHKVRERLKELLSMIIILPSDTIKKALLGGLEAMRITTKMKIVIAGIVVLLALSGTGVLVWNSHQSTNKLSDSTSVQSDQKVPLKSQMKSSANETHTSNITDGQNKDKQKDTQLNEASAQTDLNKVSDQSKNESQSENKSLKTMAGGSQALSPEVQKKSELYTELASIIPEYVQLQSLLSDISSGKTEIDNEEEINRSFVKLDTRLFYMFESVLRPPAIMECEDGSKGIVNTAPALAQIAEYLGKELPFDGNSDYNSAKDYQGGTESGTAGYEDIFRRLLAR
jgi:RNA polymerase sigma factor (sigma-70 family)